MTTNSFGQQLHQLRLAKNMSQQELANALNKISNGPQRVSKSMISRWENGKTDPQMEYVRLLTNFFNVNPSFFVDFNENKTLGPAIKKIRIKQGLTQEDLSKLTGFSQNTISNHENGNRALDETQINTYAKALKTTPQGLFDVFLSEESLRKHELILDPHQTLIDNTIDVMVKLSVSKKQKVYDFASDQLDQQNNPHKNNITKFPNRVDDEKSDYDVYSDVEIYGAASAGPGEILMDEHTDTITYHGYVPQHDYALIVNGNSMEPLFADQQVIFVDKTEEAYNGQIVIAYLNGNAYVKKLWISSDKCELVSLNPDYKPIEISKDDDFCIDGVVVL